MKKIISSYAFLSLLFASVLMTQSCKLYHSPVSPEQAYNKGPVKITMDNHDKLKFKSLVFDNGRMLGVTKQGSRSVKYYQEIPGNFSKIQVKDRVASTIMTVTVIMEGAGLIPIPAGISLQISLDLSGMSRGWRGCLKPEEDYRLE